MSRISVKNLLPSSGQFNGIYRGVVEINADPDKRGRCKIRIYGLHTQVKTVSATEGIPSANLPWAEPCLPIFEGSISGFGMFSVPVPGAQVYVFFENGNINQPRYFASAPGIPKFKANTKEGFNDPSGNYPLTSLLNESDWNRLARDKYEGTQVEVRKENLVKDIPKGSGDTWDEPEPYYLLNTSKYPHNTVFSTHGGFIFEIDSTPSNERLHIYHPSNSYIEISSTGEMIIRNDSDKYDIVLGDIYEYINGISYRYVSGEEYEIIGSEKKTTIASDETKIVQGKHIAYGVGGQTLASGGAQNISAKSRQNVGVWGNQSFSGKGAVSHSCFGFLSSLTAGFRNSSSYGPAAKNSMGPGQTGGTPTLLGKKPITEALNKTNSALAGVEAAINKAISPILEQMQKFQEAITEKIQEVIGWANGVLQPVTDIVVQIDAIATYVKTEMDAAKQLFDTVTTAPQRLISTIANYANTIMNFPGQVGLNILNQVTGIPANLNLVKSLMNVYSTANEIYTSGMSTAVNFTPTIKTRLEEFLDLKNYAFDYSIYTALGDINLYPRSGLFGIGDFLEGGVAYFGLGGTNINDQYFYTTPTSAYTSMSTVAGSGGLATELNEMNSFVTNTLSAAFVDGNGDFQMNDAIDYVYTQVATTFKNQIWAQATIDDFENGTGLIDYDSWYAVGGIIHTTLCSEAGYLTDNQQEHTQGYLLALPLMDHDLRIILWDYPTSTMKDLYDDATITEEQYRVFQVGGISTDLREILEENPTAMMKDLYDTELITEEEYQSFRLPDEDDITFEDRMAITTAADALTEADSTFNEEMSSTLASQILDAYISTEIETDINIIYTDLDPYITELVRRIKESLKELFAILIEHETDVREIAQYLTVENADWEGKYTDFPVIE